MATRRIPTSWCKAKLGDVCLPILTTQPTDSPDETYTYIDIGSIDGDSNRILDVKTVSGREAPSRARQVVRSGDILFSTVRTYLGKIAKIDEDYDNPLASTGFVVIRPAAGISSDFLFYQVLSPRFLESVHALQTGTSYPAVRSSDVLGQTIVLPPLNEQRRIVAKLSASLSALQRAETASTRALQRLKRYRTSVQYAAVTGELTRSWRVNNAPNDRETANAVVAQLRSARAKPITKSTQRRTANVALPFDTPDASTRQSTIRPGTDVPEIPATWTWTLLDEIAEIGTGISVSQNRRVANPIELPYLRVANVLRGHLDLSDVRKIRVEKARAKDYLLHHGDVLFTEGGDRDKLGRGWIWEGQLSRCLHQNHVFRARIADVGLLNPKLVSHWGNTFGQQFFIEHGVQTTNLASINRTVLGQLPLPVPPLKEQREILRQLDHRLTAADKMSEKLGRQVERGKVTRQLLLRDAFVGSLVPPDESEESASSLLTRAREEIDRVRAEQAAMRRHDAAQPRATRAVTMKEPVIAPDALSVAFARIGKRADARRLFTEAGYTPENVAAFYETLRATPDVRTVFERDISRGRRTQLPARQTRSETPPSGRFRLAALWLEDFRNLKNYTIRFDVGHGLDVVLGWNGTGKSNLFEALVIIFRDLNDWVERNRWPDEPLGAFRLSYEIEDQLVEIEWSPATMKRPALFASRRTSGKDAFDEKEPINRTDLILPRFVFAYYSGPTNRLAEHFLPMKQAHYVRLRSAKADDAVTLSALLEQRRFFCAETHHAKYVLLAFLHKEDPQISEFLRDRLRIVGFESALFVIRKPQWAKKGSRPEDFWGATGIMRRVMERLRRYAIAPMVLKQQVSEGYRTTSEDHYYFLLPDLESLHAFAAEYEDARTFFLALESTDFSELIHDVKIQVSVKATDADDVSITFRQMSEGEQQLLMVLGLMRFTKSHQSLVLLDEPDTHLNPHWSIRYLKDLTRVMSDKLLQAPEQQTSQLLMATHDPLVIASLVKEQIHLLTRDESGACRWVPASVNPRGLGFTGILTSDMFGFRSDLDEETLADLDNRVRLVAKQDELTPADKHTLEEVDKRLVDAGFSKAFSDPYYSAFVRAWGRRHTEQMAGKQFLTTKERQEVDRVASEVLKEAVAEVEKETAN